MLLYFLLILGGTLALDPCDGNYAIYNGSTTHKGVSDSNSWDWDSDTACDLHSDDGKMLNTTCGRCDAKLFVKDVWYRFKSPWTKLVEVPKTFCNTFDASNMYVDVCNAPSQFLLAPSGTDGSYNLISTRFGSGDNPCTKFPSESLTIERKDCNDFYLYKVLGDLQANAATFCTEAGLGESYKNGFCMEDRIDTVSLRADHHFAEPNSTITITAERSPAPLTGVTCQGGDGVGVDLTPLKLLALL
eukprot:sb/3468900/